MLEIELRPTWAEDHEHLKKWLSESATRRLFPVEDEKEIEEASVRWLEGHEKGHCVTALHKGRPVGIGILFIQNYLRLRHQCQHILIVSAEYRRQGVGSRLLEAITEIAKEHGVELIHVEVVEDEDVVLFYRKRGYEEFGRQAGWILDGDQWLTRILLERFV